VTLEVLGNEIDRWANALVTSRQIAEVVADTEFVSAAMRGRPEVVTAAIMYGLEVGVSPMQALQGINVVEGRPQPSAELMRGLILAAGHTITVHDMTGERARVSGLRNGRPETERLTVEWNLDMARAAGLAAKRNWRAYPRAMLLARATSDLARLLFPDVVKGLGYIAEDDQTVNVLSGTVTEEPPPVAPPAVPRRKRRPLPSPGHTLATEDRPGPDGSIDVPLPTDAPAPDASPPMAPAPGASPNDEPAAPVMPDLEPEATPDEPTPGPKPMAERPFKALQASLARTLGRVPREDRLAALGAIVGRPIASSHDLTRDEGYTALGFLARVESGAAGLVKRNGEWEAVAYGEPPEVPGDPSDPWAEPEPFPEIDPPEPPHRSGRDQG
jgi:hypothetical protein